MTTSRTLLTSAIAGVGVLLLVLTADALRLPATPDVAFWPAAGFALGVLLVVPRRTAALLVPGLLAGAALGTFLLRPDDPPLLVASRAVAELVGPLIVAALARAPGRWRGRSPSPSRGVLSFVALIVLGSGIGAVAMSAASVGGVATLGLQRVVDTWAAVGLGMLVVGPAMLALLADDQHDPTPRRSTTLAILAVALALVVFLVPGAELPPAVSYPFVILPLLLAAAVRGAPRASALTAVAIVTVAWIATASGVGPVVRDERNPADRIRALQALVATVALSSLLVVSETSARRRTARALSTSEERYRTLVQGMPDAMALLWDAAHRCVAADGPMLAREGLERDDLVGRTLDEVLPREQVAALRPLIDDALHGVTGRTEIASGQRGRLYEAEVVPVHGAAGGPGGAYLVLRDVSARRRQELGVRRAESDLVTTFGDVPVGRVLVGGDGRLRDPDQVLAEIAGRPRTRLEGLPAAELVRDADRADLRDAIAAVRDGRTPRAELEVRLARPEDPGTTVPCVMQIASPTDGASGATTELRLVDVTDERLAGEQLASLARRDPLTGLPGRAAFCEAVDADLGAEEAPEGALLLVDLDDFVEVNAALGRHVGDAVIVAVADLLRELRDARDRRVAGRIGGDSLAVLLPDADAEEAERLAAELVVRVREGLPTGDDREREHPITASCGLVLLDGRATTGEALVAEGELAVQDAKNAGRDRWARHARAAVTAPRGRRRLEWIERIEHGLEHDGFVLEAQPIEALRDRTVTQHELLLRLRDDDGGLIPPARFLPVAERFGLVGRVDRWVLTRAIDLLARLEAVGSTTTLEVNVSGRSLGDPRLLMTIEEGLRRTGVDPSRLVLEVTETAAVGDVERARRFSDRLGDLGCGFALDDFGVGFGSFYYLKHLRWDYLKIDGEFVRGCLHDRSDRLVIDALVRLAQGLERRTIAEYVGDPATRAHLHDAGVDLVQGYHVGRPVPLERAFPELDAPERPSLDVGADAAPAPPPRDPAGDGPPSPPLRA